MTRSARLPEIDVLRGAVMVLMALDHARDYFGDLRQVPENLTTTTCALFFTRWVTHFCAPVFVFLAGSSIWLRRHGAEQPRPMTAFLLKRGLLLLVLEFTLVNYAWVLSFDLGIWFVQVIAAIGVAMIAMAGLVALPPAIVGAVGLAIVMGHGALSPVGVEAWPNAWPLLFGGGAFLTPAPGVSLFVVYSMVPWIGVMALGYALGPLLRRPERVRRRALCALGVGLCLGFVFVRSTNVGGDPTAWVAQDSGAMTVVAFLNCSKYPPSPLFLAMTLGPALLFLGLVRGGSSTSQVLATFGRVALFYYLLHVFVIHLGARLWYLCATGVFLSPMQAALTNSFPPDYGGGLVAVYVAWLVVVAALYPICAWFAALKRRSRAAWLSYL